jgi:hypothetical protein
MLTHRHILNLSGPDGDEIVRRSASAPLNEGDVIEVKHRGRWVVTAIVVSDHDTFADGLAYCVPHDHESELAS